MQEEVALLLAGEAVEVERVVARRPGGRAASRACRARGPPSGSRPRPRGGSRRRRRRSRRGRRGAPAPRLRRRRSCLLILGRARMPLASEALTRPASPRPCVPTRGRPKCSAIASRIAGAARVADRDREGVGGVVGVGGSGRPSRRRDHLLDLVLVGRARSRRRPSSRPGACSRSRGRSRWAAASIATPRAWPTLSAEPTFLPKKRSSSAIAFGLVPVDQLAQRLVDLGEPLLDRHGRAPSRSRPPSSATIRSPTVRTTPNPVFAAPGSIPMTIMPTCSAAGPDAFRPEEQLQRLSANWLPAMSSTTRSVHVPFAFAPVEDAEGEAVGLDDVGPGREDGPGERRGRRRSRR